MKPPILLFLLALFSVQTIQSQVIDSTMTESKKEISDFHFERSHKLKKTGYILLAAGGGAILTSYLIASNAGLYSTEMGVGSLIFLAGVGSTVASIPLFITAHNHKKKAELILSTGNLGFQGSTLYESGYASVGFRVGF